jgi:hypothetical protein
MAQPSCRKTKKARFINCPAPKARGAMPVICHLSRQRLISEHYFNSKINSLYKRNFTFSKYNLTYRNLESKVHFTFYQGSLTMNTMSAENYTQRSVKNARSVLVWSFLWGFSLVIAGLALKFWWPQSYVMLAIFILVHLSCALGALRAHQVWLKGLDELQQQIQLHSMAFTLGLTWIAITLLLLLSSAGIFEIGKFHLPILAVVMAVVGTLGSLIGMRKAS